MLYAKGEIKMRPTMTILAFAAALTSTLCGAVNLPALSEDALFYDWTVNIQTQHLDRQFQYEGSTLKDKIDRLDVDIYYRDDKSTSTAYESLWYFEGKPLGLELFNKFFVKPGQGVCVSVTHRSNTPSAEEMNAAANAIMRIWVDSQLNQNAVIMVRVPQRSFSSIVSSLQRQGMVETPNVSPDQLKNIPKRLYVESEPRGLEQRLNYM